MFHSPRLDQSRPILAQLERILLQTQPLAAVPVVLTSIQVARGVTAGFIVRSPSVSIPSEANDTMDRFATGPNGETFRDPPGVRPVHRQTWFNATLRIIVTLSWLLLLLLLFWLLLSWCRRGAMCVFVFFRLSLFASVCCVAASQTQTTPIGLWGVGRKELGFRRKTDRRKDIPTNGRTQTVIVEPGESDMGTHAFWCADPNTATAISDCISYLRRWRSCCFRRFSFHFFG